ncbi:RNA-splicing ligase RtcB [Clostridium cylindrosporum]|uniref:3'-phosphate/5'-hydroxy nucleic acid ligase n=1 Tax=Clostridium cylindrosporum DSM 605 TaxID=1121307 RepID=A0A0J8G3C8_CLOCY|nr:RNA-splicing ligase RtcB [Clostridium cylindrosporum]KMT22211.1 RNA-splicing ligase RtcB [Clostridium cylindrosporum DSM 605]
MIEIKGKYANARVYTDNIDESAKIQIRELCDEVFMEGQRVAVMPDVHAGKGCTIGTTITIKDKIVPNLVGVDIGCGVITAKLSSTNISLDKLDNIIKRSVPSGHNIRKTSHSYLSDINLKALKCRGIVNLKRAELSLGTLGGGNHFIELNRDDSNNIYLCIHSGSRHLGCEVAQYYQRKAIKTHGGDVNLSSLAYLDGEDFHDYIHDMKIVQEYANLNRRAMVNSILKGLNLEVVDEFNTIHNYIDTESMILRKGAVSARKGERLLIPINMRDGSLICKGLGSSEWNYSAPHGAGRLMSRTESRKNISIDEFLYSMKGIYSSTVSIATIDEAPMAYKSMEEIVKNIKDTVEIISIIKPIYNYKSS